MPETTDWNHTPLGALVDHINITHHSYLHRAMPLLRDLLTAHTRAYWMKHPELFHAHTLFCAFQAALEEHLIQEETAGFPLIHACERDPGKSLAPFTSTIEAHRAAHANALQALANIRQSLWNYRAPGDVGEEVRVTCARLEALAEDLTTHIHLENEILFPRLQSTAPQSIGQ